VVIFISKRFIINEQIRGTEVRLIDENGQQLGIVNLAHARQLAQEKELDLILIAPQATPPVCKIGDIGKLKYEAAKKEKEARKARKVGVLKEIKLGLKIEQHDLAVKTRKCAEFLQKGNKVKFNLFFKGREMTHQHLGQELFNAIIENLKDCGQPEAPPKLEGRNLHLIMTPK
jgi:translation initiation factor IF-3